MKQQRQMKQQKKMRKQNRARKNHMVQVQKTALLFEKMRFETTFKAEDT